MISYKRRTISSKYFALEILNCPIEIIFFAAQLGSKNVTIENFSDNDANRSTCIDLNFKNTSPAIKPHLKRYEFDFCISNTEYLQLIKIWDTRGCYALFHEKEAIRFKATLLDDAQRYKALDNFGWNLELAIPGPASSGWGQITSPIESIIEKIENQIKIL